MKATHNVKAYRNNTDTASQAAFFGSYISHENVPIGPLCTQVAALSGLTAIQVRAILEGSFDAIAELEKEGLVVVHLDGMSVWAVITGSFPTGDAAFDPESNKLELSIRLDDSLRLALVNETAQMVTDADLTKVRLDNVKDLAVERPVNLIHGRHPFRAAGYNLVMSDAGARVYLTDRRGVEHEVVVDEVHSNQLFTAHTAELLEGGDYTLWVESRAGVEDGPLQRDSCRVKYLRVEDPPATVVLRTAVTEGMMDNNIRSGSEPVTLEGENLTLGEGDTLWAKNYDNGDEDYVEIPLTFVKRNTSAAIDLGDDVNDPFWAWLGEQVEFTEEHDRITFKLVSHGGVPSSEPQVRTCTSVVQFA